MNLASWACCFIHEQSWYMVAAVIAIAMFVIVVGFIIVIYFSKNALPRNSEGTLDLSWTSIRASGAGVPLLGFGGICAVAICFVVWVYDQTSRYRVALDTGAVAHTLEQVRTIYQSSTSAVIQLDDAVRAFQIIGKFEGECVPDMLDSVCRSYAREIQCTNRPFKRTYAISRK